MLVCCQICPTSLPELPLNINYATAVFSEADQNPHILSSVCYISLPVLTSLQRICPRPVPYVSFRFVIVVSLFNLRILEVWSNGDLIFFQNTGDKFEPVVVNRATLQAMEPSGVLICRWPPPLKYQFYRNLLPDLQIIICNSCNKVRIISAFIIFLFVTMLFQWTWK